MICKRAFRMKSSFCLYLHSYVLNKLTMLRKIRIILASVFFIGVTLLFLDFTGTIHAWLGWMAKVQFLPALLAVNFGVVAALLVLTLIFGRVYCSVICPLGIMQDIISWIHGKTKKKKPRRTIKGISRLFLLLCFRHTR